MPGASPLKSPIHENLPPKRQGKAIRKTSAPLRDTSFQGVIFAFILLGVFLGAFWTYHTVKNSSLLELLGLGSIVKRGAPNEGYDGTASGTNSAVNRQASPLKGDDSIAEHIASLASILSVPAATLAAAIQGVVAAHVPPSSRTSIAKAQGTDAVVKTILEETGTSATPAVKTSKSWAEVVEMAVGSEEPDFVAE
jgi:hypothetical protein